MVSFPPPISLDHLKFIFMYSVTYGFNFIFSNGYSNCPGSFILKVHLYSSGFKCYPYHILNFHTGLSLFLDFLFYPIGPVPVPHCFNYRNFIVCFRVCYSSLINIFFNVSWLFLHVCFSI